MVIELNIPFTNTIFYLLSFEINMYNIAIISNLPIIILKDRINLEIESISIVVIPTDKPLLEIVVAASNTASTKIILFSAK
jgi:hypothetical protein